MFGEPEETILKLFQPYLSPELSIDIIGCESCYLPLLGNRAQVTCCHHQTYHTVPAGDQSVSSVTW